MEEQVDPLIAAHRKSIEYRGIILDKCIFLERAIDDFICNYMTSNRDVHLKLTYIFLDRMTFESKRTALKAILDSIRTDKGFLKTKNNSYPDAELINDIRYLNDERNRFAHYTLYVQGAEKYPQIGFLSLRDKQEVHWYDDDKIGKLLDRISDATFKLTLLISDLLFH